MRHLGHAQASAVCHAKRCAVLDARRRLEQPPDLFDAQHVRQLPGTTRQYQLARQVGPLQRHAEQEAQCRHRAVDDGLPGTMLALVNLKAPQIFSGRGVGRASDEACEGAYMADIVVLGPRAHAAHRHVVEHAPTQRGNASFDR